MDVRSGWENEEASGMLGEMVYDAKGKNVGMRVLPDGKLENSVVLKGTLSIEGEEFTCMYTANARKRPDGTIHVDFSGFFTTPSGGMGELTGMGNGVVHPDGSMTLMGVLCHNNPPGRYARYNGITVVWENETDKDGNVQSKGWEWK